MESNFCSGVVDRTQQKAVGTTDVLLTKQEQTQKQKPKQTVKVPQIQYHDLVVDVRWVPRIWRVPRTLEAPQGLYIEEAKREAGASMRLKKKIDEEGVGESGAICCGQEEGRAEAI